jgi:hypothetical protein
MRTAEVMAGLVARYAGLLNRGTDIRLLGQNSKLHVASHNAEGRYIMPKWLSSDVTFYLGEYVHNVPASFGSSVTLCYLRCLNHLLHSVEV